MVFATQQPLFFLNLWRQWSTKGLENINVWELLWAKHQRQSRRATSSCLSQRVCRRAPLWVRERHAALISCMLSGCTEAIKANLTLFRFPPSIVIIIPREELYCARKQNPCVIMCFCRRFESFVVGSMHTYYLNYILSLAYPIPKHWLISTYILGAVILLLFMFTKNWLPARRDNTPTHTICRINITHTYIKKDWKVCGRILS